MFNLRDMEVDMPTTFKNFSALHLARIKADVVAAKALSQQCLNSLIYRPNGPPHGIQQLLFDTFMIPSSVWRDDSGWDRLDKIKLRFGAFGPRMDRSAISFSSAPANPKKLEFGAFVKDKSDDIFISSLFFGNHSTRGRSATLIHEFIHLVQVPRGHPGGEPLAFGQTNLAIPFDKAVDNPYCYQYFAEWIT
jgi:hypothetical protein